MALAWKPVMAARIAIEAPTERRQASVSVVGMAHRASAPAPSERATEAIAQAAAMRPERVGTPESSTSRIEALHMVAAAKRAGLRQLRSDETRIVPGRFARIMPDGYAAAPRDAPARVQEAIWAANRLVGMPYVYGGGHGSFFAGGYDCSGTVSFALHGGDLLSAPLDSSEFYAFGASGHGRWLTVYTSPGHAFLEIAGIRLDTSTAGQLNGEQGPRWRPLLADTAGYTARHPAGY
jgi:cell wall-associated NlpC family hydrolase